MCYFRFGQGRSQRSKRDEAKRGELSYLGIVIGVEIRVFRALPGSFDSLLPRELRWPEGSGQIIFQEMSDEATASSASAWLRPASIKLEWVGVGGRREIGGSVQTSIFMVQTRMGTEGMLCG